MLLFALLLTLLSGLTACGSCGSDKQKEKKRPPDAAGQLLMMVEAGMFPYLERHVNGYRRENPKESIKLIRADYDKIRKSANETGEADLLLIAGRTQLKRIENETGFIFPPEAFMANYLVIASREDSKIELKRPFHLLQPVAKGPALAPPGDAAGETARRVLKAWRLDERLDNRLVQVKDAGEALSAVSIGKVDAAFVYNTDFVKSRRLESRFGLSFSPYNFIPYYLAVPEKSMRPRRAAKLVRFLMQPSVQKELNAHGFLFPQYSQNESSAKPEKKTAPASAEGEAADENGKGSTQDEAAKDAAKKPIPSGKSGKAGKEKETEASHPKKADAVVGKDGESPKTAPKPAVPPGKKPENKK